MRENEELRGLLNCGHTRDSAYVVRVVGEDFRPIRFNVWGQGVGQHHGGPLGQRDPDDQRLSKHALASIASRGRDVPIRYTIGGGVAVKPRERKKVRPRHGSGCRGLTSVLSTRTTTTNSLLEDVAR